MRRVRLGFAFLIVAGIPVLFADEVVLKDGKTLITSKPYVVKGKQAIVTMKDGTVMAVPVAEIDLTKTAEANKARVVTEVRVAVSKPLTPAEAARSKSVRKAAIVLSDEDVSHSMGGGSSEPGKEDGEGRVEVVSVSVKKGKSGYTLSGSVFNSGKGEVLAVSVTVEAVGEDNKTLATAFGNIAKDNLASGEKSAFTAELPTEAAVSNFRYVPHWQTKTLVKPALTGGNVSQSSQPAASGGKNPARPSGEAPPAGETPPTPEAKPAPKAEPTPAPRPDYAAPSANAPIGAPTQPGGTYLPQPSADGQPKQPGS